MDDLTPKQKRFVKDYLDTGNGTEAALNNYDIQGRNKENIAASIASENLTKPNIVKAIENEAGGAFSRVVEISKSAENEAVKLSANKDILDRAGYKPGDKIDLTTKGEKITLTSEHMEIAKKYEEELKKQL